MSHGDLTLGHSFNDKAYYTDKCVFRCHKSNVRRLLPASDYGRALFRCLNCAQRFDYGAVGNRRKLGGAAEPKRIGRLSFEC